ncbi:DUF3021 domain-containing protein [Lactobacillus ultunensis]|uniref:DUF3021 domain-containing protein n=1 Tax=Lactobacillus ultunensis DSM 16047 TaxID=525365 RepID=C2EK17_9LACO|nr:DUF3021 domain-containing protein [Lactobacillus ultunensis]EEJ73032.1 hypothetical protein HMPREF0548_0013 [Lactobacillus ultunensis DSM 16047]QQP29446.1 DUF3021 domain-containing protein [Lactobacillus ultunensis]
MKRLKTLLHSGLIGISIGMIWIAVEAMLSLNIQSIKTGKLPLTTFLFWLVASFLIGIFFNLASWIFDNDKWSLRKQIIVNFFICFVPWILFCLLLNDFNYTWHSLVITIFNFIIMYAIAYGGYFFRLWLDIKHINEQLKKKG